MRGGRTIVQFSGLCSTKASMARESEVTVFKASLRIWMSGFSDGKSSPCEMTIYRRSPRSELIIVPCRVKQEVRLAMRGLAQARDDNVRPLDPPGDIFVRERIARGAGHAFKFHRRSLPHQGSGHVRVPPPRPRPPFLCVRSLQGPAASSILDRPAVSTRRQTLTVSSPRCALAHPGEALLFTGSSAERVATRGMERQGRTFTAEDDLCLGSFRRAPLILRLSTGALMRRPCARERDCALASRCSTAELRAVNPKTSRRQIFASSPGSPRRI
jgi:hypothetical protein